MTVLSNHQHKCDQMFHPQEPRLAAVEVARSVRNQVLFFLLDHLRSQE